MSDSSTPANLIQELDARQDELLAQLAELNQRVEALLKQYLDSRAAATTSDPSTSSPQLAEAG